ncbi:hypothetical protein B0J14DRAFT_707306 [Halenospora varia]|nr:hypothetical protein B0J14DRAFT_707306 [Halenospora varia]
MQAGYETQISQKVATIEKLNEELAGLQSINDEFQKDLGEVQLRSFKDIAKASRPAMEDTVVKDISERLHKNIEDWAEDASVRSWSDVGAAMNSDAGEEELFQLLKTAATIPEDVEDIATQMKQWKRMKVYPEIILAALATYWMYRSMTNNPFLVLDLLWGDNGPQHKSDLMKFIYDESRGMDQQQANKWRSHLMRTLFATTTKDEFKSLQPSNIMHEEVSGSIKKYCASQVNGFLNKVARPFLKERLSRENYDDLLEPWIKTFELFTQLQTQQAEFKWFHGDMLGEFFDKSKCVIHRSQDPCNGDYNAFDGRKIGLVVSPLVVFYGNEEGENYEEWRTVVEAVVLCQK